MGTEEKTAVRPRVKRLVRASNARAAMGDTLRRAAAKKAYRAKIESLLDQTRAEQLADVWQRVCPLPVDLVCELPDRCGIIKDLADFAEVLQPSLDGMECGRLCGLIAKYAAFKSRSSDLSVTQLA